ncbi:MAG: GNAT family N-acetyltransferase [Pseudomonadota bacterium]|nr:GNAT family N-acetyltransferase [Pseudomonadota bacterium]
MPTLATARPEDAPALTALALRSKAHWGYDEAFMEACREELRVPPEAFSEETVRLARNGDTLAGFYRLALEGETAEIEALFVDPPFIGTGIGRALWHDLVERVQAISARRLLCQSDPFAEGFYLAMGMARIGERESGSLPGRMLPLLEMQLLQVRD